MWTEFSNLLVISFLLQTFASSALELDTQKHWDNFKSTFKKNYRPEEDKTRRAIFEESLAYVSRHNLEEDLGMHSFKLGINHLSDLTHEEFLEKYICMTGNYSILPLKFDSCKDSDVVPDEIDYREEGLVTPVMNQGDCGGCYAFASVASVEGAWKRVKGELKTLSVQHIIDCSSDVGNRGCKGGDIDASYIYMIRNGIASEESYPFEGKLGSCRFNKLQASAAISGFQTVAANNSEELKKAVVTKGVIAVSINIRPMTFKHYKAGIYDDKSCNTDANHEVVVVGYGAESDKNFWLLKNSWGTTWGEKGYMKILRSDANVCGVLEKPYYPIV